MFHVLSVVLPIFALILVGWLCRRTNRLGPQAASEINKLVVWLCLPAMLFKVTATSTWAEIWQPGFLAAFTGGCLLVFFATLVWRLVQGRALPAASIDGLSASYANTGYMGIPLCLLVFGQDGLEPALIASLLVVCVLFAIAVVCIEVGLQNEKHIGRAIAVVLKALGKNPLVVSPILGGLWAAAGIGLPTPLLHFLDMLAAATTPCALVSLGLFLAQKQETQGAQVNAWPMVAIKLVGQPLLTGFLAYQVFDLPPLWADSALLLSALPTGTGPFMLAEYYQREAAVVSRSILVSTLGSLVTLSLCLLWLAR
ncbi:AEC family transporter [Pseudomonas sp. ZM23]|uniref:AEC family transporter n=1 Tax=Pseudomonas triclosanedens TaxID=2961893 RepID=A0ABY6ZZB3_9PSED|nr:AEC family transporter [Pseudomonas triclosanedens]MCP8462757.1 AEC family transporter [Pseudomonas triclosanedens]MCP8468377.1 AEC family transporter [Pseudomonas triclosanedens]MCP8475136.1 AEC family transporter [Pseudomonas triclosanedens]WAI49942.1 AEC family transporter [Pseudomonas triclosanedens]